jgi:hypothetical protein
MLDEAGRYLEQNSYDLAVVAGYADMKGDTEKERKVTAARASRLPTRLASRRSDWVSRRTRRTGVPWRCWCIQRARPAGRCARQLAD